MVARHAGADSEVCLIPRRIFSDPFRGGDNILVMSDCYEPPRQQDDGSISEYKAIPTNTRYIPDFLACTCPQRLQTVCLQNLTLYATCRAACAEAMKRAEKEEPWFGVEQEYTLLNSVTKWPLGWPSRGFPGPQGPYYCSAGTGASMGREIVEAHIKCCYFAGIKLSGESTLQPPLDLPSFTAWG